MKAEPGVDLYCAFSSVVDSVTFIGLRDDVLTAPELLEVYARGELARALDRADERGSSDRAMGFGSWWDRAIWIGEAAPRAGLLRYYLPRGSLRAYLEALVASAPGPDDVVAESAGWPFLVPFDPEVESP